MIATALDYDALPARSLTSLVDGGELGRLLRGLSGGRGESEEGVHFDVERG